MKYRCWFKRWDGKDVTMPGAPLFDDPAAAIKQTQFEFAWNGPTHPKGASAHGAYVLNGTNFWMEEVALTEGEPYINRRHGNTGVPADWPDEVKELVFHWAWLLPRNGKFTLERLATEIAKAYDIENPRTYMDVLALKTLASAKEVS